MRIYAKFLEDSFRNDSVARTGVDQKINVAMTFRISWICDTNGDVCQSHVFLLPAFRCGQNARHHLHANFLREACAVDIRARAVRLLILLLQRFESRDTQERKIALFAENYGRGSVPLSV